jgi:hypothetical protein
MVSGFLPMANSIVIERWGAPQAPALPPMPAPAAPSIKIESWGAPPDVPEKMSVAGDVVASGASGLVRGAAETAMSPISLPRVMEQGVDWLMDQAEGGVRSMAGMDPISEETKAEREAVKRRTSPVSNVVYGGQDAVRGAMDATLHKPETVAGEYARTLGEFAPALLTPGSAAQKVATWAVPAVTSETAGQVTKGTKAEPWARAAGAIATGVGVSALARPGSARAMISEGLENIDDATLNRDWAAARDLLDDAAARGVDITPVEALNQVSDGRYRHLAAIQRAVENSRKGSKVMDPYMGARAGQVARSGRAALDDLQPRTLDPTSIGTRMQEAAVGTIDDTRADINAATRPLYDAAGQHAIPKGDFASIASDPAFQSSLHRLRADDVLGPRYAGLPDNSVAVVDAVTKDMRARATAARNAANAGFNPEKALRFDEGTSRARDIARDPTRGGTQSYDDALTAQETMRRSDLAPLENGPMGRIAETSSVTQQRATLLPQVPESGMAPSVGRTVSQLAARDPEAAANFVRQHAETVFGQATKNLQGGKNQFGGANFAKALRANPEQAASLEAAVRALPNGDVRWQGFNRFLNVMEATGQRLQRGSETAFNQQITKELQGGTIVGQAANLAAGGGLKLPEAVREAYQTYRYGKNTEALAKILTDPKALPLFEKLLRQAPAGTRARTTAIRLMTLGTNTGTAAASGIPK